MKTNQPERCDITQRPEHLEGEGQRYQTVTTPSRACIPVIRHYPILTGTLVLLLISALLWALQRPDLAQWVLLVILLWGGIPLTWDIGKKLLHKEVGIDLIAILAIGGSLLLHQYVAGAVIVLMLSGGEALESYALQRASHSLSELAERAPRITHIWRDQQLIDIPVTDVQVGMVVVIKPGEIVPVDGAVEQGASDVSEADLTGEPLPVHKTIGMMVLSGCVNLDGILELRAMATSEESKYAQIIRLVQEAQEKKAPIHRLADRYSLAFTAITLLLATATWLLTRQSINVLAVLVVATPCPLILATPIAIMSGINRAARAAIIVKSGAAIEQLGEVDTVIFDKTGTLTLGTPQVTSVLQAAPDEQGTPGYTSDDILYYAASVEQLSTHILAHAIVAAGKKHNRAVSPAYNFEEILGKGVRGQVPQRREDTDKSLQPAQMVTVSVGNRTFCNVMHITLPPPLLEEREKRRAAGQICSFVALDSKIVGLLIMEDVPRPEMIQLCPALKREHIKHTVLLTGDGEVVANKIGKLAGVDHIIARCLPEDKVKVVSYWIRQGNKVLMVGDGINDAPALAAASVGMALGYQGLTAAASSADTVLLSHNILRVVTAIALGRHVMRIAQQGIWIGIGLSSIAMVFAACGFIPPTTGAFLQEGIDALVIFNALRVGSR